MDEMFEIGKSYVFYFYYGDKVGYQQLSGQVVSYEHPFVKVETKGLIRIINCSSNFFIEAISRNQGEEPAELVLEIDSL
ncbi:hypothetical protein D1BOALGB6SA_2853 [Olavius sp. associated proteobacterium Delta 1]|nr:hypothetical protein D1BOALGB6SA_2853 [Olavius sp. associated proteobacterium Delta 1]